MPLRGKSIQKTVHSLLFMNEINDESKRKLSAMSIYMLYFELMVCVTTITVAVLVSWWLTQCASVVDNCVVLNSHLVHGFEFRTPMNGDGCGRYMQKELKVSKGETFKILTLTVMESMVTTPPQKKKKKKKKGKV